MGILSDRIINLAESETLVMAQKSREVQAKGFDVVNLSLGEPDFNTPDFVKAAAKKAIDDNFSKYMPVPGYQDLREVIAEKFKRDNNLNYKPSQIVVSTGAKQSITNVVLSVVNPGDEVIIPIPYWVTYREIVRLAEGIPVYIKTGVENNFKFTAKQLSETLTDKSKLLIFSTPCNPSGSVFSKQELKEIAAVIAKHPNLIVICDEIYEYINFVGKHESLAQFPEVFNQVVTVNGVSKGFAMTGWRIGYLGAPQIIADACIKMQGQFTSGASSIAQRAALEAIKANPSVTDHMKAAFHKRRDLLIDLFKDVKGVKCNVPEGAFYLFPDVSYYIGKQYNGRKIDCANDLCMYLLEEFHVALVTGEAFGDPNCIRISYATSEDKIREAVKRIKAGLEKLS